MLNPNSPPSTDERETIAFDGRDTYTLSTGREFYANCGIIGMSPEFAADGVMLGEGYDGHEYTRRRYYQDTTDAWTEAERLELATHMAALWMQWATAPAPIIEIPKWTDGDWAGDEFVVAITDRMRAAGVQDGCVITADVAEQYYPKAEWLAAKGL